MRRIRVLLGIGVAIVALARILPSALAADPAPRLRVVNPFVAIGTSARFSITGASGSTFVALLSRQPAEVALGAQGTLFLKPGTIVRFATGTIDASESATVLLAIPNSPSLNGVIFYVQALVTTTGRSRFTNAVPIRAQTAPASGPRGSRAIATTPNGAKAYVAHQLDGSVSVIDAVTDVKLADLPVGPSARGIPHRPLDVAVDPEGRYVFVANAASSTLTVIDVATDSVAAQFPVPTGCRRVAFDFSGGTKRIYVTNEVTNSVLVIEVAGGFSNLPSIPLQGSGPGPIAVLPGGQLMIGHRASLELEVVDPAAAPGGTTVARIPLRSLPFDVVVSGPEALVPTFIVTGVGGFNRVLRVNLASFQVTGFLFENQGTDYTGVTVSGPFTAVVATGSGAALVADTSTAQLLDRVDVGDTGSGAPTATPQDAAFVTLAGNPTKLYVVDQFRETVRPVLLSAGPPFALSPEIALAHVGHPRLPLSGDLSIVEEGEWAFRSVQFFNGGPLNPNQVTCQTCHTDGASHNITFLSRQAQPLFGLAETVPYGWEGTAASVLSIIRRAFSRHGHIGGPIMNDADTKVLAFFDSFAPPLSIHLGPNGTLSPAAQAGKALFEGRGQCTTCHAAPAFIPPPPEPRTILQGVGTGLMPANVPSLRGVWATGPYLHNGEALTLEQVFRVNLGDVHFQRTDDFTDEELAQLAAYLKTL